MEIKISNSLVPYENALAAMEKRVAGIRAGTEEELLWFLEHPPLYTAGTSAQESDLRGPRFPVYQAGRGGQYTYHGPGQRTVYVMRDLRKHQQAPDIKKYVWQLEEWIIRTLACFDVTGERREGRIGIWVIDRETGVEEKIAAIGVRVRHWVSYHGIAINLNPDLSHFSGIVPCGISDYGVTSLEKCGLDLDMARLDKALIKSWGAVFEDDLPALPARAAAAMI